MQMRSVLVLVLGATLAVESAHAALMVSSPSLEVAVEASALTDPPLLDSESALDLDASDGLSAAATASVAAGPLQTSVNTTASAVLSTDRIDIAYSTHWDASADDSAPVGYASNLTFGAELTIPDDGELRITWGLARAQASTPNVAGFHGFDFSLGIVATPGGNFGSGQFMMLDALGDVIVLPVSADDIVNLEVQGVPNSSIDGIFTMDADLDASVVVEYLAPEPGKPLLLGVALAIGLLRAGACGSRGRSSARST
jgi:hypothetical protein